MANAALLRQTRYSLFNSTASQYDRRVMPALGPLALELLKIAVPYPGDHVLDVGTATGTVALPAAPMVSRITGVDFAPAMLPLAQQNARKIQAPNLTFYQGNMDHLPHPANTFSLVLSSFSLNSVDPAKILPEIRRILQSGGRLVFQEWGKPDTASQLVKQTIKRYRVEQATGELAHFRLLGAAPKAWDELGEAKEIAQFLQKIGFAEVKIFRTNAAVPLTPKAFYNFRTAWTSYQAELAAMAAIHRAAMEDEILTTLSLWAESNGHFIWRPELVQMIARK